jgi:hypothetical protein
MSVPGSLPQQGLRDVRYGILTDDEFAKQKAKLLG